MKQAFRSPNRIRNDFSTAMSNMYQAEVPAYGDLIGLVAKTNSDVLASTDKGPTSQEDTKRISLERHGAIRLGTPQELSMMARIFAVMGMFPVGYYDLSIASVPVHSTAFRPIERKSLAENPFRVFTSLLRLELIDDEQLRETAQRSLEQRKIFTDQAIALTQLAEAQGGLNERDAADFVQEVIETFRWHSKACVDIETFNALNKSHRLIADVVSFKGPHINHLTPRTLDIDAAQSAMIELGLPSKAVIEGPPRRQCPILLRQTSFKALEEEVHFPEQNGEWHVGTHTARFGEIEQRGVALTPSGRDLYDRLLDQVRAAILPATDGSNAAEYQAKLVETFADFPDNWRDLFDQGLAYFKFTTDAPLDPKKDTNIATLLDKEILKLSPIVYEDFLPVSAAGIFQSNLGDNTEQRTQNTSSQGLFEKALGKTVSDPFELYQSIQDASLKDCFT